MYFRLNSEHIYNAGMIKSEYIVVKALDVLSLRQVAKLRDGIDGGSNLGAGFF